MIGSTDAYSFIWDAEDHVRACKQATFGGEPAKLPPAEVDPVVNPFRPSYKDWRMKQLLDSINLPFRCEREDCRMMSSDNCRQRQIGERARQTGGCFQCPQAVPLTEADLDEAAALRISLRIGRRGDARKIVEIDSGRTGRVYTEDIFDRCECGRKKRESRKVCNVCSAERGRA